MLPSEKQIKILGRGMGVLLAVLAVLAVCVFVPVAAHHFTQKGSVIERLREIS